MAAAIACWLAIATAPADAVVTGGFGLQQRSVAAVKAEPLQYHGGRVLHSSDAYVIYWDPAERYRFDWERLIDKYFQDVGAESGSLGDAFALNAQYGDASGRAANHSTFRGAYTDTAPYPTSGGCSEPANLACLTDQQIQAELQHVVSSVAPPLPGATGPAVYYLLTPPGVTVCTDAGSPATCSNSSSLQAEPETGICGYHSVIDPGGAGQIIYVVQPWIAGDAGEFIESLEPLETSGVTPDVLACQDRTAVLKEPNQVGRDKFNTYAQGLADVIINDLSVEQSNVVVDPLLDGWYQTATHAEQGDMCQANFGPPPESPPLLDPNTHAARLSNEAIGRGAYYLQWGFNSVGLTSNWGYSCWQGVTLEPSFTSPNPVNSGDIVGFDASESDVTLDANTTGLPGSEPYAAPVYRWDFGDGTSATFNSNAAPVFHTYQSGGTYNVTLTVTDSGGNTASATNGVTVIGPPPPSGGGGGGGGGAGSGSGAAAGSGAASGGAAGSGAGTQAGAGGSSNGSQPGPIPVTTAAVSSRSLRTVLRRGLVVRYSVSERVTGRFEVLLARSLARRLGLHGPAAAALAAGTAPQIVIGKAFLVTATGGRNSITIQFSRAIASKLRGLHGVSLMLRLVVRNSSGASATLVATATLKR